MPKLPKEFTDTMRGLMGTEYDDFIAAITDRGRNHHGLRINTLKTDIDKLKRLINADLSPVKWCNTGFYYDESLRPAKLPYYQAGLYYIQEPSAMSPASVLPIEHGDRVLDVCAAPGGKTTHLAAKLGGSGVIVSNDISGSRCAALIKNIDLMGIKNAVVTNEAPKKLAENFEGWFDKVLIDAPCSGEGMFRKDETAIKCWTSHSPEDCTVLQEKILEDSACMLKPGGMMVYSTCTFNPSENELMIQQFINKNSDFEIVPIDHEKYGLNPGRYDWADGDKRLFGCARVFPHKNMGEGHFLALLKKSGEKQIKSVETKKQPPKDAACFVQFCENYLLNELCGNIALRKYAVYLEPYDMPELRGIRALKTGLYVGDIKNGRFEPSTAFALALKKSEFKNVLDFENGSEQIRRYLNGESFEVDASEGYNLVCVDGYALGFGKVVNGRLKNRRM